ncbi:MAG: hypothetical protein WC755_08805 [Candidatus Woesearchaeota archaeon]|jgi:hypothetical protein
MKTFIILYVCSFIFVWTIFAIRYYSEQIRDGKHENVKALLKHLFLWKIVILASPLLVVVLPVYGVSGILTMAHKYYTKSTFTKS